jgi:hypothetical protein
LSSYVNLISLCGHGYTYKYESGNDESENSEVNVLFGFSPISVFRFHLSSFILPPSSFFYPPGSVDNCHHIEYGACSEHFPGQIALWSVMNVIKSTFVLMLGILLSLLQAAPLHAQSSFYEKKTIQVVIGSAPGGLYDRWARLLAQHMGKYIPGHPNLVAQNMPGGGSIVAANYLYGIAKPDGLTIGMFQTHMYLQQLVGVNEVKFDMRKFNWLGSQEKGLKVAL